MASVVRSQPGGAYLSHDLAEKQGFQCNLYPKKFAPNFLKCNFPTCQPKLVLLDRTASPYGE